jgi:hypothetical protein
MSHTKSAGARILDAQASHCKRLAAELAAARAAGAPAETLADLEAQELAARKRYQEFAVDMPSDRRGMGAGLSSEERRPWWRFW